MGVASLVLGIISLIMGLFLVGYQWLGAILGLIGIILGAFGRQNTETKGLATGGLVCSIIGFILCIAMYALCASAISSIGRLAY